MPIYQPGGGGSSSALTAHEADTTAVHGIADTSALALTYKLPTNRYHGFHANAVSTLIGAANGTTKCAPYYFPQAVTIDRIGIEVTVAGEAGSLIRLGVYGSNATTGLPDALIADFGTTDGTSVAFNQITVSQALGPGIVWFTECYQAAATTRPTVRTVTNLSFPQIAMGTAQQGTTMSFAYPGASTTSGGLPASYTPGTHTNTIGRIQFRIAA